MKTELVKGINKVGAVMSKNMPSILTGLAVAGLVTTVVMAVKATPKAEQILAQDDDEREVKRVKEKRTKFETVKLTWKCYAPATIMGGITVGCIIGANSINLKRSAALSSLYAISESTLKEYQSKVIETIGENKEQKIKDEIAKDRIEKVPCSKSPIVVSGGGNSLFFDAYSGRYFMNDIENVRKIQNDLNQTLISEMFVSLNDFYYELGLPKIPYGEECGWNVDAMIDLSFDSQIADDGRPCVVLDYCVGPRFDYRKLM